MFSSAYNTLHDFCQDVPSTLTRVGLIDGRICVGNAVFQCGAMKCKRFHLSAHNIICVGDCFKMKVFGKNGL